MSVIHGTVDNGQIVMVASDDYTGPAGYRDRDGWAEIAFVGSLAPGAQMRPMTINGRGVRILRLLPTANRGVMTVLAVAFA